MAGAIAMVMVIWMSMTLFRGKKFCWANVTGGTLVEAIVMTVLLNAALSF